jgi:hypothetical protein
MLGSALAGYDCHEIAPYTVRGRSAESGHRALSDRLVIIGTTIWGVGSIECRPANAPGEPFALIVMVNDQTRPYQPFADRRAAAPHRPSLHAGHDDVGKRL